MVCLRLCIMNVLLLFVAANVVVDVRALERVAPADRPNITEWKATQAAQKKADANATAKEDNMGAIHKTVKMLEDLQKKLVDAGDQESWTYNKFACFCKDTIAEKNTAIKEGTDNKADLEADVAKMDTERDALDTTIKKKEDLIESIDKEVKIAKEKRAEELKLYTFNAADLSAALEGLEGAMKALKASDGRLSFVQMQGLSKSVQEYAFMADAMGIGGDTARRAAAFFQQPDVEMEPYKFKSDDVIATLEGLNKEFRTEKESLDKEEVTADDDHEMFLQKKAEEKAEAENELAAARKAHAKKMSEIAETSEQLTTVSATLLDDQQYLEELAAMCNRKAVTWDSRLKVRGEELSALTAAKQILEGFVADKGLAGPIRFLQHAVSVPIAQALAKSDSGMEEIEEATESEEGSLSFLQQVRSRALFLAARPKGDAREAVLDSLRGAGKDMKSTVLMNLVSQLSGDKFAKVKILIQELIERLQKEAIAEANQKAWCDKSQSDAAQKRDYAADEIRELNGDMARLEALRDKLVQELDVLGKEIKEIKTAQAEATKIRKDEKAENALNVKDAEEGKKAVDSAVDVLVKYYKTQANAVISLSQKGPADDAPDAGFNNNETYKGDKGAAQGIIGMLEVVSSDFQRTVEETELAESNAAQDYYTFMTESGQSLAEKEVAETEKSKQKDDALDNLGKDQTNMDTQAGLLQGAIKELLELNETCNIKKTEMSYEERRQRRKDEIAALNRAVCIFDAYEQYGPDAAYDARC